MTAKKMSFEDRALKYLKHTLYCKWERPEGWYDSGKPCTCGRDDFFREIVGMKQAIEFKDEHWRAMEDKIAALAEAWRLESLASDAKLREEG